jgi:hypothetical protein
MSDRAHVLAIVEEFEADLIPYRLPLPGVLTSGWGEALSWLRWVRVVTGAWVEYHRGAARRRIPAVAVRLGDEIDSPKEFTWPKPPSKLASDPLLTRWQ